MNTVPLKVGKKTYELRLASLYNEYNCFAKMCGRLSINDKDTSCASDFALHPHLEDKALRDKIVTNFVQSWEEGGNFKPLNSSSLMFPNDGGHYRPSVLMYADGVYKPGTFKWWQNWNGLIELFKAESKFGVTVLDSPVFPNLYYGTKASQVWQIFPPKAGVKVRSKSFQKRVTAA